MKQDISSQVIACDLTYSYTLATTTIAATQTITVGGVAIPSGGIVLLGGQAGTDDGIYSVTYVVDTLNNQITNIVWTFLDYIEPLVLLYVQFRLAVEASGAPFDVYLDKFSADFQLRNNTIIVFYHKSFQYIAKRYDSDQNATDVAYTKVTTAQIEFKAPSWGALDYAERFTFPLIQDLTLHNVQLMEGTDAVNNEKKLDEFPNEASMPFQITTPASRISTPWVATPNTNAANITITPPVSA
jgi:hypothetical protein